MTTLTDTPASTMRPLRLLMRPDLAIREQRHQGQPSWVVKDPVGLKYFRLCDEELLLSGYKSNRDNWLGEEGSGFG